MGRSAMTAPQAARCEDRRRTQDRRRTRDRRASENGQVVPRRRPLGRSSLAPVIAVFACVGIVATGDARLRTDVAHLHARVHALEHPAAATPPIELGRALVAFELYRGGGAGQ